jgi:hypothetical protein
MWNNPLDFSGYSKDEATLDLSAIKIFSADKGAKPGRQCRPFDFFTL